MSTGEQPVSDPANDDIPGLLQLTDREDVNAPVDLRGTDQADNRNDIQSAPFVFMLPEILEKIFSLVPERDRANVTNLCESWNRASVRPYACWRALGLGRSANCFSAMPSFDDDGYNIFPLTHIENIKFDPAFPSVMREPEIERQIKELPLPWLSIVLRHGVRLKRLNLSAMRVSAVNLEVFRSLTGCCLLRNDYC